MAYLALPFTHIFATAREMSLHTMNSEGSPPSAGGFACMGDITGMGKEKRLHHGVPAEIPGVRPPYGLTRARRGCRGDRPVARTMRVGSNPTLVHGMVLRPRGSTSSWDLFRGYLPCDLDPPA